MILPGLRTLRDLLHQPVVLHAFDQGRGFSNASCPERSTMVPLPGAPPVESCYAAHPHTRGANDDRSELVTLGLRPIPTRVGQTSGFAFSALTFVGPSPHAWGKRWTGRPSRCRRWAHPHKRGANQLRLGRAPPRVRPIPTRVGQTSSIRRRIRHDPGPSPHAWGKRSPHPLRPPRRPAHPHTRGANVPTRELQSAALAGPSPHAWGKRHQLRRNQAEGRPIPTRVGQTQRQ